MKRAAVIIGLMVLGWGWLAADEQPGFRNTDLKIVISVSGDEEWEWDYLDDEPSVDEAVLSCLNTDGVADGVTFTEANGVQPNLRIDVSWSYSASGTTQISASASVSGLNRGHLFDATSGPSPFTVGFDASKALADDIYRWIHQGWTYNTPQTSYSPPGYGYGGRSESRFGTFAVGFSVGRGGGLFAGYASFQPLDFLGVEFDYGTQPVVTSAAGPVVTLWPSLLSAKLQAYGGKRSHSPQLGFEVAADKTEEAGWGAHGALLLRLRSYPLNVDFNAGLGHFFNYQLATKNYAVHLYDQLGYLPTDLKLGFVGPAANYLVGGIGLSISF
jgi:hypothetical protein